MSQGQQPPTDSFYYGFNDMDFGPVQDMAPPPQLSMDGMDSADMMALLDHSYLATGLDTFGSMPLDQSTATLVPPFTASLAPPISQAMGQPMAPTVHPAPLVVSQPGTAPTSREPLTHDGTGAQQSSAALGTPASAGSSSADFTKRRNWPAKVIEEMRDLLQVLDGHGLIKYVSPSVTALTGYHPDEIMNLQLKDLIHPDDAELFVSDMNEAIASGGSIRIFYRLKKKDGTFSIFEAVGRAHVAAPHLAPSPSPASRGPFCQAVFLVSRPYPTKNAALLDSFLEHKVDNERLRRRIESLQLEEEVEEADVQRQLKQRRESSKSELSRSEDLLTRGSFSVATSTGAGTPLGFAPAGGTVDGCMPPPDRPPADGGGALTRENLEGVAAGARPDSLRDKMARYERGSPVETIEMLTGRRYVEGGRGRGLASGRTSPKLITGDAGIKIPVGREARAGEKKRKQKLVEEYVCTDCGTLESPEWRKGPSGPKTLCNACGLRWAKKEKKRQLMAAGVTPSATSISDQPMVG